jgi:hypothetical protein
MCINILAASATSTATLWSVLGCTTLLLMLRLLLLLAAGD